jgi:nudix-type nucleoside diphosphatase (YffH/AdpP family)
MSNDDGENVRTAIVKKVRRLLDSFLSVDEAEVTYPRYDGALTTVTRQSLERGDSVAVLAVDPARPAVWLVEQFRYPTLGKTGGWLTELPAGMIDALEAPEDAARRETVEETGIAPEALEHIATFYVSPGGTSERIYLYYAAVPNAAANEELSKRLRDKDEDIKIINQPIDAFLADASSGRIADAKTLVAALWLDKHRERLHV